MTEVSHGAIYCAFPLSFCSRVYSVRVVPVTTSSSHACVLLAQMQVARTPTMASLVTSRDTGPMETHCAVWSRERESLGVGGRRTGTRARHLDDTRDKLHLIST